MVDTEGWQAARLIPTSGINGQEEAERRATSALLAVLQAVPEFRTALLRPLGAPAGTLSTFIEVQFKLGEDRVVQPDGVLCITRGKTSWTALVEVKTGAAELERQQVENYLDVARAEGLDSVITISNQMAPAPGVHPVAADKRKLRKVTLHHLSWPEILTAAVRTRVHHGVADPDQAWILGELIRYLEHPRSGALDFSDMGSAWVAVRDATIAGTVRASDKGVTEVASRWDQLLRFAALRLGRELGADVQVVVPRKEVAEPHTRLARMVAELATTGTLSGAIHIPDSVGDLDVCADLRAGRLSVSVDVAAPQEGRPTTRVSWLARQLKEAPAQLRVDALLVGTKASTSELLSTVREDPAVLVDPHHRDFRVFRITATSPLGTKRGTGRGTFIDSVLTGVDGFYEGVVQAIRPWQAKAPQLPKGGRTATAEAGIDTSPPPGDLADPVDPGLDAAPGDGLAAELVDVVAGQAQQEPGETVRAEGAAAAAPAAAFVEWSGAAERLDRERDGTEAE